MNKQVPAWITGLFGMILIFVSFLGGGTVITIGGIIILLMAVSQALKQKKASKQ